MPDNDFTFAHRDEGFDNHIDKSIRGYQDMLKDVVSFSRYFIDCLLYTSPSPRDSR